MNSNLLDRFRPRLWPTLFTLLGLAILLSLGTWQAGRYFEKLEIEEERDRWAEKDPIEIGSLSEFEARAEPFRRVELRGRLDADRTFLFKHRTHDEKPGGWIGSVLQFEEGDGAVLVNRGWVHRERFDEIGDRAPPDEPATYVGLVHQPDDIIADDQMRRRLDEGLELDEKITEWDTLDLTAISSALPYKAPDTPTIVMLGSEHSEEPFPIASHEYVTEPYLTSERHLGYATFWYTTALALLAM
ncbi:MAG: SURF1 family protein, partial [Persicimonas sp.]